jgi:hypothetical protein
LASSVAHRRKKVYIRVVGRLLVLSLVKDKLESISYVAFKKTPVRADLKLLAIRIGICFVTIQLIL